jgi:hypothetical protein
LAHWKKEKKMANIDRKIKASERQVQALELRQKGYSLDAIAKALGYHDASGVLKAIKRALKSTVQESAKAFQILAYFQFQMLHRVYMPRALAGDIKAARFMVNLIWRECKLMGAVGLDYEEEQQSKKNKGSKEMIIMWESPNNERSGSDQS